MKKLVLLAVVLTCLLLISAPEASACFNVKYVHQGVTTVPVMDFTIVLVGERAPINFYMDSTGYRFTGFSYWFDDGNTYLKWINPVDPTGLPVDPAIGIPYCTWMYIGWELGEPPAPVIQAYWTDPVGNPIYPDGWVKEMWHEVYPWPDPWLWIYYTIDFELAAIDSVYYKVFYDNLPLNQMTWHNPDLWPPWDQMTALYTGGSYPLVYGDSIGWALPGIEPGYHVVFAYRGFCNNIFWDFGQHLIEQEGGPVYDLWETPENGNTFFEFGCDIQPTIPALPADFFGPGSDPFEGQVACVGEPLETDPPGVLGSTNTIVERETADLPECPSTDSVETQIIELSLVSIAPITVSFLGGSYFEEWDVYVCLSDRTPPPGYTIFNRDCQQGGTFFSEIAIYPRFIFNKVTNPEDEVIFDFGDQGLPPVNYNTPFNGYWLFEDPGFGTAVAIGGELVSHCRGIPDRPIGRSGVDLIPGLQASPCNDCETPPSTHNMPFTSFAELDGCAQQDAVVPRFSATIGRCCYNNNQDCADMTEAACLDLDGNWDAESNCIDNPCPTVGRCCYNLNQLCDDMTEAACLDLFGNWDEHLNCIDNPCPTVGRCCYNENQNCVDTSEVACRELFGNWDEHLNCIDDPCATGGCDYAVGDVNSSGGYNGLDITYGVAFFKGGADPLCPYCPPCESFHYCGDVNASCNYNGLDITYGVNYFKGGPGPMPCEDCPPAG